MKNIIFELDNNTRLVRVYKSSIAKKCFNHNLPVLFCPVNMDPTNEHFNMAAWIKKQDKNDKFQNKINAFEYYNCNRETGYYTAFYIPQCRVDRFSGEKKSWNDTINTIISYDYEYAIQKGIM